MTVCSAVTQGVEVEDWCTTVLYHCMTSVGYL